MLEVIRARRRALPVLVLAVALGLPVRAGAGGIVTDRPTFTEAPDVVPARLVQLEAGGTYASMGVIGAYNVPELWVRYGIAPRVEARVGVPDYVRVDNSGNTDHRLGLASFGLKLQGLASGGPLGLTLVPAITLPVDPDDVRHAAPEMSLVWWIGFSDSVTVSGHAGYAWLEDAGRGADELRLTLTVAQPVNPRVATFVEWSGVLPREGGTGTQFFHHGYAWSLSDRLQVDVHGALGLTHDAPDFTLGAGVSVRP